MHRDSPGSNRAPLEQRAEAAAAAWPSVSVVIGTYNESDNIEATVRAIFEILPDPVEIVIVDDNSPDGTAALVEAINDPRIKLVRRKRAKGLASAIARGIMESSGAVVSWIDADMAPEIPYLVPMVEKTRDFDVVIASRYVDGGGDERHPVRTFCSRLVNRFASALLGYGIRDYDSCVVAVRREVFDDVLPIAYGFGDFFIEFVYDCCRRGFSVVEVPLVLHSREGGASKSFPSLSGFLWLGFKYCWRILTIRLRPD